MYTLRGTHTGDELGVPPTGCPIAVSFMGLRLMPHGKMIETWNGYDRYHLFRQIGASLTPLPDHLFPPHQPRIITTATARRGEAASSYLCVPDWTSAASATPIDSMSGRFQPAGEIHRTQPKKSRRKTEPLTRSVLESWFDTIWHGENSALADAVQPSDGRDRITGLTILPGLPGFALLRQIFRSAFPDIRCRVETALVEGGYAFARVIYTGTHTGSGLQIPPTARRFEVEAMHMLQFDEGHISDIWSVVDLYTLFGQLGLLTPVVIPDITAQWLLPRGSGPDTRRDEMVHDTLLAAPAREEEYRIKNTE
jgi:predicted ester cyclase